MGVKLGILGLGTVGTGTVQLLLDQIGRDPLLQEIEIYRVGVRSLDKPRTVQLPQQVLTTDLESIVTDPAVDIVVEVMGGLEKARSLIKTAIQSGKHVVTANKAVIARYGTEIFTLAQQAGVYIMLEAAVGGGIPVIQPLKQSLSVNRIQTVIGIVNGTTNYILTRMQTEGSGFDEVLADAQKLGYAEADPTTDVDGLDAADKIAILASIAHDCRVHLEDVYCEGIRQVSKTDIAYAEKLGFVIKLLAIANRITPPSPISPSSPPYLSIRVHPTLVPQAHPLASIGGVNNAILIEGKPIGQVMFFGPGAGAGATASAVSSDILNLVAAIKTESASTQRLHQNNIDLPTLGRNDNQPKSRIVAPNPLLTCRHKDYCQIAPIAELITRFYARFLTKDQPGVIGKLGTCFGNHGVSLESIVQTGFQGELAEIVVVTHDVREGDFRSALAEIRTLEAIDSIPSLLRVL